MSIPGPLELGTQRSSIQIVANWAVIFADMAHRRRTRGLYLNAELCQMHANAYHAAAIGMASRDEYIDAKEISDFVRDLFGTIEGILP